MDTMTTTDTHLTADLLTDGWTVVDDRGGRWHPDEDAAAQIATADDPETEAIVICMDEPMRGTWCA